MRSLITNTCAFVILSTAKLVSDHGAVKHGAASVRQLALHSELEHSPHSYHLWYIPGSHRNQTRPLEE
jgi:hypothetical protein